MLTKTVLFMTERTSVRLRSIRIGVRRRPRKGSEGGRRRHSPVRMKKLDTTELKHHREGGHEADATRRGLEI